jgi:IS6 family transposase
LYRGIDPWGATIDFLLSAFRDADAAKRLFRKALGDPSHRQPRVINTELAPIYSSAIPDSKKEGTLRNCYRHRPVQYLNNVLEQDHRASKRRVNAKQVFGEFRPARRTIQGYEAVHMIRKGQVRWVAGDDLLLQIQFIRQSFRFGSLRTHHRRSPTNLSAFETCNTTRSYAQEDQEACCPEAPAIEQARRNID